MGPKANQAVRLENAASVKTNLYASLVVTKQWRLLRIKIRNLLNLGVSPQTAIQHSVSSKRYWRMASTPALQQALSNAWLKAQGLVNVKDPWSTAQGYAN